MSEDNGELLEALETLRNIAAVATGLRADLIKEGWNVEAAEQLVLALMRKAWSTP